MNPLRVVLLVVLCLLAVITDLKSRKIPNKVTMPFALMGLVLHIYEQGLVGAKISLLGFLLGFFVFLIPYAMRAMGAGDVKLMAALGAISDWQFILYTTFLAAIFGGLIVIIERIKSGGVGKLFKDVGSMFIYGPLWLLSKIFPSVKVLSLMEKFNVEISREASNYIPYALAIGLGTLTSLLLVWTGRLTLG